MTGGPYRTPVLRVPAPVSVPVLRVPTPTMPAVVRSQVAGAIGPSGAPGPQGAPGDYGSIRYDELSGLPATTIAAGALVPFVVTQPTIVDNNLRGPFAAHAFLGPDNVLRARAVNDVYTVRPRLRVTTTQAGGQVEIGAVVQANISGIVDFVASRKAELSNQAGVAETVDFDFLLFPKIGFLTNGARLMLRCSVPAQISSETLFIVPGVAG